MSGLKYVYRQVGTYTEWYIDAPIDNEVQVGTQAQTEKVAMLI